MTNDERDIQRKLKVLQHAEKIGNVRKACRYFGIGRSSFYRWREAYQKHGEAGLKNALCAFVNFDAFMRFRSSPSSGKFSGKL